MRTPQNLEPAERDPVAIRRTLFIIIMIIFAGFFVARSYVDTLKNYADEYRPPVKQGLISAGNLGLIRHDGEVVSWLDLQGQIWLLAQIATTQPETGELGREVMKELSEKFADTNRVRCVLLTIDSENDKVEQLAAFADGMEVELPDWWMVGADMESVHKYVQAKMKFGQLPYREEAEGEEPGKWVFDTSVMIVDPTLHIRGHYDFDKAVQLDEQAEEKGKDALYLIKLKEKAEQDIAYIIENPLG